MGNPHAAAAAAAVGCEIHRNERGGKGRKEDKRNGKNQELPWFRCFEKKKPLLPRFF